MKSLALLAVLAGCAGSDDPRPQTLAYITETILAPNCASAECHSDLRRANGYVFDTVAHAQKSMDGTYTGAPLVIVGDPATSYLVQVISLADNVPNDNRMPLDHPLDNRDIYFIESWIENGADGFVPPP